MIKLKTKELHFDEELKIVETTITELENRLKECEVYEDLSLTPDDILIKRDIDYINKLLYPLEYDLNDANDTIYELEDKVSKLEETLNYFKELWRKFIKFLQDKFFSSNKYDEFINDLYDEDIIDDNELDIIQNNKDNQKDDLER